MKPIVVLITPRAEPSPNEGEHPKHIIESFLNQKIGKNNGLVDYEVVGTIPDHHLNEVKRFGDNSPV